MVWGLEEEHDFGKFYLNVNSDGWDEIIDAHVASFSEEKKAAYRAEDRSYRFELSLKFNLGTEPLEDFELQKRLVLNGKQKTFGDFAHTLSGIRVVSQAMKDLIEELEPGVHQFWELEIVDKKGNPFEAGPYYGLKVLNELAAFDPEQSDKESYRKGNAFLDVYDGFPRDKPMAIRRDVFGDAHIWTDSRLRRPDLFFSDDIHKEMKARKLSSRRMIKLIEV